MENVRKEMKIDLRLAFLSMRKNNPFSNKIHAGE